MSLTREQERAYARRILLSRMRILSAHPFFGLLLMHASFFVDEGIGTACTDGKNIRFCPKFMDELSDSELDFIMMHEIMHIALMHCNRGRKYDPEAFNIACDIVVNSNILLATGMKSESITLRKYGESMHLAPSGTEGYKYTAEEVYAMLPNSMKEGLGGRSRGGGGKGESRDGSGKSRGSGSGSRSKATAAIEKGSWDDHSRWGEYGEDETYGDVWAKRVRDAAITVSVQDPGNSRGTLPLFAERLLRDLRTAKCDWRTILADFISREICDYSFSPPDRRFDGTGFFLPDYSDSEDVVEDILFMIDTSASMSDGMITDAYSEIKGAVDMFDGKLRGWLGFFDAAVVEPEPFCNEDELYIIRPYGGGGTSFEVIFRYVRERMTDKPPASIIILTDGQAPYPSESMTGDIPVLWVINNETVTPPWGRIARI